MKTKIAARHGASSYISLLFMAAFAASAALLVACTDPLVDDGGGGRAQQGTGGAGASTTQTASNVAVASASSTTTSTTTVSTATTGVASSTSTTSGGPVECDLEQTAQDVVLGCAEGVCAGSWSQLTSCQAGCGVFPSASCVEQNCLDEVLTFSRCLSTCPEYVACDPCLLSCINLKNCGFTTLAECYATCPSNADDAVWACGASMLCEVVPMCPQLQGL